MSETPEEKERRLREAGGTQRQNQPDENPLFTLIKALLAFFVRALLPDKSAPDFEDAPDPKTRAQAEREYVIRQREEEKLPQYTASIPRERDATVSATAYSARLMKMRQEAEAANGGAKVEAIIPVHGDGRVTSDVGHRHAPMKGASKNHKGIDFASPTPGNKPDIISTMPGIVVGAGWKPGYGNTVDVMDVYGKTHRYGHLDSISVKPGEDIAQGQKLGVMGMTGRSTGVHLHYEQHDHGGKPVDDPILMGRSWDKGDRFSGRQNQEFLAAQKRPDGNDVVVASAPQVPAAAAASVARAGIKPESLVVADTHDHSHDAPAAVKPVRTRS